MSNNPAANTQVKLTYASVHDGGTQLELSCSIQGKTHYFASFVAEEQSESLFFELVVAGQNIRVPLEFLENAIAEARKDVHSESWYDRNSPITDGT